MIRRFSCKAVPFQLLVALAILGILPASEQQCAADILLYDDSTSQKPGDQSWLAYATFGGTATETIVPTGVTLATDNAAFAGYSSHTLLGLPKNPAFPVLNRVTGFALDFELKVNDENHVSPHRAGFSVLLLSSDSRGIELGFWEDEIWAQSASPLFTHAESVSFNTTTAEVEYQLAIQGNAYSLFGNSSLLLSGSLRDYSAFGGPPYTLQNFLFLGDNTSSANANVTIGNISLSAVPEPSSLMLIAITFAGVAIVARRRAISSAATR